MSHVAIVGGGNTMNDAPFNDPTCEIWTTASVAKSLPRVDKIFEFHEENAWQDKSVYAKASNVYYRNDFPIDKLAAKYGEIFNSSMTMILAYAVDQGYEYIDLYGIDNALENEYMKYRPQFLYMLGIAKGNGVKINVSKGSLILTPAKRYCYEKDHKQEKIDAMELDYIENQKRVDELRMRGEWMRGAIDSAKFFSKL